MWILTAVAFQPCITLGVLELRKIQKKMEEPEKMLVFLQISLPFFSISHLPEGVATFFVLSTLHWWAYSVMAWCLVEKWAIGKLVRLWFHRVSSVSLKYVTYRQKITKIMFWALNSIFHTYFVYDIILAYTTEKLGPWAIQICMTLIGQHARSDYDYVPENSGKDVKNGNVDKIRRRPKKQKVHFFFRFWKNKKHGALRN